MSGLDPELHLPTISVLNDRSQGTVPIGNSPERLGTMDQAKVVNPTSRTTNTVREIVRPMHGQKEPGTRDHVQLTNLDPSTNMLARELAATVPDIRVESSLQYPMEP